MAVIKEDSFSRISIYENGIVAAVPIKEYSNGIVKEQKICIRKSDLIKIYNMIFESYEDENKASNQMETGEEDGIIDANY